MFHYYQYPFDKADEHIERLSDVEKSRYLETIYTWVHSKAYKTETQEMTRTIYRDMANKAQNSTEFTGYRLTLIALKKLDQRLLFLAQKYEQDKSIREINESIN